MPEHRHSFESEDPGNLKDSSKKEEPEKKEFSQPPALTRRDFIKQLAGFGAIAAFAPRSAEATEALSALENLETKETKSPDRYVTGSLEGRNFADLYSLYTGIKGRVPAVATVDFDRQLRVLFEKRESFAERKQKREAKKKQPQDSGPNTVFRSAADQLLAEYKGRSRERMTVQEYLNFVRSAVESVKGVEDGLDWDKLAKVTGLKGEKMGLLRKIANRIDAKALIAYSLTELMPSVDGKLNIAVLDFLLRNAGARYVYSIPAVYDDYTSFGPYQFTSFALYDTGKEKRGASEIAQALRNPNLLPGSVSRLRGVQHHRAAYLFAIYNIALLIRKCRAKQISTLNGHWHADFDEVVKFIATAHHLPGGAVKAARRWLDNNAKKPFEVSCSGSLHLYALKTKANLDALKVL